MDYNNELLSALQTPPKERTEGEKTILYSLLHRLGALNGFKEENFRNLCSTIRYESHGADKILYKSDDLCNCWYIIHSGSVFIQGSMFLKGANFGKQIPGTKRRGSQCITLEDSELLVIDYLNVVNNSSSNSSSASSSSAAAAASLSSSSSSSISRSNCIGQVSSTNLHHRNHHKSDSLNSARSSTLDSVTEIESSSTDSSPAHTVEQEHCNNNKASLHNNLSRSQSSISKTTEDGDEFDENDEEDSISLRSESSIYMKDLVIDVVKKSAHERNADDLAILMEFTKSLQAFSNMTEPTRRAFCKVMVFAWVQEANTLILQDKELLDSWSVIINGQVLIKIEVSPGQVEDNILCMGESFGVQPTLQQQRHTGVMSTICDDCQFLCVAQTDYYNVLHEGQENQDKFYDDKGDLCLVKEFRVEEYTKPGSIVIRGSPDELLQHLLDLDGSSMDETFVEDYLLTYRCFNNEPLKILRRLIDCYDTTNINVRNKVSRIVILWINNHFSDFENDWKMMAYLEEYDEKMKKTEMSQQQQKLFKVACTLKAEPRSVYIKRESNEHELGFEIWGGAAYDCPIYVSTVHTGSHAELKGVKRGDQLIEVNGQNFEKLSYEKAYTIIKKNTDLQLSLKTSLFSFKEKIPSETPKPPLMRRPNERMRNKTRTPSITLNDDLLGKKVQKEAPEDVIKVYRADQSHRFIFVNRDTTAGEAVKSACRDFGIVEEVHNYSLYKVSVQGGKFIKQSKLPDPLVNLAEIPLGARYYLKLTLSSEKLLPDENIPELLKEENFSFLDLDCYEVAFHLTREDYQKFRNTESIHYVNDLFKLDGADVKPLMDFEAIVNQEHFWVATMICTEVNSLTRAKIMKNVIKVAHHCKNLKNLNSTFALISGLAYRSVSRMRQTWEKVPAKSRKVYDDLLELMNPSRNMSKYRTLCNDLVAERPVIPYIPVVKKDLTFLHLGNDTHVDGLINFEKMRMIAKEIRFIRSLCEAEHFPTNIRPTTNEKSAYQTISRRGRRGSFNNARKMYEDQINQRRVKQFMKGINIIQDEEQLMELSKSCDSSTPLNSSQTKRRAAGATDSPSRSSKTLPSGGGGGRLGSTSSSSSQATSSSPLVVATTVMVTAASSRNNSEPQISQIPVISLHPTRRKVPLTSLPKFGATSPRALEKLLKLSVEGHEQEKKNHKSGGGGGGSCKPRSGSATALSSSSSSPITSPSISSNRSSSQRQRSNYQQQHHYHGSNNSNSTIGHENINRNNNRHSMPVNASVVLLPDHYHKPPSLPAGGGVAVEGCKKKASSARSSIASNSSGIGTNPSTYSSLTLSGSSPRSSSPDIWGSVGSISTNSSIAAATTNMKKPPLPLSRNMGGGGSVSGYHHYQVNTTAAAGGVALRNCSNKSAPHRSSSSSSADTVKSTGSKGRSQQHERPIIMSTSNLRNNQQVRASSLATAAGVGGFRNSSELHHHHHHHHRNLKVLPDRRSAVYPALTSSLSSPSLNQAHQSRALNASQVSWIDDG